MYVVSELEIFGKKNNLEFLYDNFNFEFIKKSPSYLINYSDLEDWRYKNWGTETDIKLIHKNLIWDRIEQKLSILFETSFPPLKIINYFAIEKPFLHLKLYYYDYYDGINGEYEWNDGLLEYEFKQFMY